MDASSRLVAVLLALAIIPAGGARAQQQLQEAEAAFRAAFAGEIEPEERVAALERVVKEHADSAWADDALWALGEAARQQQSTDKVIYYWQYLMSRRPDVELEDLTRSLPLYQASRLPQAYAYLEATGMTYVHHDGVEKEEASVFVNAKPFNPVPMLVWEELGRSFVERDKLKLALKAYDKALEAAPPGGRWQRSYRAAIQGVEIKLEARAARAGVQAAHDEVRPAPKEPGPRATPTRPGGAEGD